MFSDGIVVVILKSWIYLMNIMGCFGFGGPYDLCLIRMCANIYNQHSALNAVSLGVSSGGCDIGGNYQYS